MINVYQGRSLPGITGKPAFLRGGHRPAFLTQGGHQIKPATNPSWLPKPRLHGDEPDHTNQMKEADDEKEHIDDDDVDMGPAPAPSAPASGSGNE